MRVVVERDVPRRRDGRRRARCRRSTSRGGASARCGTSRDGTLCHREVAAYELSDALGWEIVPDTVLRDGPLGVGAVQRFVDHDPEEHYFTLLERPRRRASGGSPLFDVLANNTDRKGGHCLHDQANDVDLRHRPRPHVPRAVEAAHRHLGLRRRARCPTAAADDVCRVVAELDGGPLGERLAPLCSTDDGARRDRAGAPRCSSPDGPARYPGDWLPHSRGAWLARRGRRPDGGRYLRS